MMKAPTTTTEPAQQVEAECTALSPYEPTNLVEARQLAADYAKSGLVKMRQTESVLLVMATGRELGIPATAALRSINIIQDRPCPSADLLVALCLRSQKCEYFDCVESDDVHATYATRRRGRPERRFSFTLEDAKKANLLGKTDSNWSKYPATMLKHRAAAFLAREVYPDLCLGLLTDDEARDVIDVEVRPTETQTIQPLTAQAEAPKETPEERSARWTAMLMAATSADDAKPVLAEVRAAIPDANDAERKRIVALKDKRKADGWKAVSSAETPQAEAPKETVRPAGDLFDRAAEETEREPGAEG